MADGLVRTRRDDDPFNNAPVVTTVTTPGGNLTRDVRANTVPASIFTPAGVTPGAGIVVHGGTPTLTNTRTPDVFPGATPAVTPPPSGLAADIVARGVTTPGAGIGLHGAPGILTRDADRNLFQERAPLRVSAYPGSAANTLYGIDSESYLTPEQRKLARMIQGKFDASSDSRERALQRYGAPQLSSFAQDEAMARAMSLALGLNTMPETVGGISRLGTPTPFTKFTAPTGGTPGGVSRFGTPTPFQKVPTPPAPPPGKKTEADWQKLLTGLTSILPLLFGRDAFGNLMNKGAIQWAIDKYKEWFGTSLTPEQLETSIQNAGFTSGPLTINPYTGLPIGVNEGFTGAGGAGTVAGQGVGPGGVTIDENALARMGLSPEDSQSLADALNHPSMGLDLGESVSGSFGADFSNYDLLGGDAFIPPDAFDGFTGGYDAFIP